ncbi:RHS repeat-associated core domain-containing protein [Pseudomonas sp. B5(2017)]|uniref:RHS repeat-associated core domain-containing protein n=1 Tax=Pseudomonas sp. B5(2017) TaxID=1981714 RepID=UPI00111C8DFF|nr:RHS repeat-associated core domain-containing protein [Pseudomonas sp. B5(2017)]
MFNQDHLLYFYMGAHLQHVMTSLGSTTCIRNGSVVVAESLYETGRAATTLVGSDMANSPITGSVRCTPIQQVFTPYGYNRQAAPPLTSTGFTGQPRTSAAPMYLMGNGYRAYITILMRLCSPDALSPFAAGGINAYAYCGNDPINYSDQSGRTRKKNMSTPTLRAPQKTIEKKHKPTPRTNEKFDTEFELVKDLMTRKRPSDAGKVDRAGQLDPTAAPELTAEQIEQVFNPPVSHAHIRRTPSEPFTHVDVSAMREWHEKSKKTQITSKELNTWSTARALDLKPEVLLITEGIPPKRAHTVHGTLSQQVLLLRETINR